MQNLKNEIVPMLSQSAHMTGMLYLNIIVPTYRCPVFCLTRSSFSVRNLRQCNPIATFSSCLEVHSAYFNAPF